ncbi:translocation/assembly module TamB domain-containing protein [Microvirga flavescens]|uniref:translocation/assembly module TamB domain-containing protein n=1 Tax=Microvirga flavescens TaxID=2249811 RepID=UPI000DD619A7|nr:translocation/assembly module TamB domain-containing protein [Microvirga flavescens]
MGTLRRILASLAILVLIVGALTIFAETPRSDETDKGYLADFISRALSTPTSRVSIGAVDGVLSSDSTIRNITIADRDGVWLRLDQARFVWRRTALLFRRLEIERLEIGKLEILRKPLPSEEPVPGADQPLLPELPVKVEVRAFLLQELALGEPILGIAARLAASGDASLGDPSEGLRLNFEAHRLDAPGQVNARLTYAQQALEISLTHDEPAGGILARALNIPGLPPVRLTLDGKGTLDMFDAQLAFTAGDTIGATGTAHLRRDGAERQLDLDMSAQVEGLLPQPVGPVFAGTTRLRAQTLFAGDGGFTIPELSLVSQTARLDATGHLGADRTLDFKVNARAIPGTQGKTIAGGAEIGSFTFDGTVTGTLSAPHVSGTLSAQNASLPSGRFAKLDANFSAIPNGDISDPATRIALVADLNASGLNLADAALAKAVGDTLKLSVRASVSPERTADVETAQIATPTMEARFTGRVGSEDATGTLQVKVPDLSRFGDVSSLALKGALDLRADVRGLMSKGPVVATLSGKATGVGTGLQPVDGLMGGQVSVSGGVSLLRGGGFGFRQFVLAGAHASATFDGDVRPSKVDVNATIDLPALQYADKRLAGKGQVLAHATGTLNRPDVSARAVLSDAKALGRAIPRLELETTINDIFGNFDARMTLRGEIDRKPANGRLHVAKKVDGGWLLDSLDITIGSVHARGNLTRDTNRLVNGHIALDAKDLDDLSPLVLSPLSGSINADIRLDAANGRQNVGIDAQGKGVSIANIKIGQFVAKAMLSAIYAKPIVDGVISIDQASVSGETFSQVRIDAKGAASASDITVTAQARGFSLDARGRLVPADRIRFEIASFTARRDGRRIALSQPATITLIESGLEMRGFILAIDAGQLSLDGVIGSALDLRIDAEAVPLSAADIFMPGLGVTGTVNGNARVTGTAQAPAGDWRIRVSRLTREAGLPPVDMAAEGRLANGRTTLNGTLDAGRSGTLRISGSAPLSQSGALDLTTQGRLDLGVANTFLSASGQRMSGSVVLDMRLSGTVSSPQMDGTITVSGGGFTDAEQGIRIQNIQGRMIAHGSDVTIENLSARTPNGGSLNASGRIRVDPQAGFPGEIRISGQRAQLVSSNLVTGTANLALDISGPLAQRPRISGKVDVISTDITVPENLPATTRPLPGTKHLHPTPEAKARLALAARAKRNERRARAFDAALDLTIAAPSRIFVRGRGIDAELGGDLRLTGTLANPTATGAFDLRRGRLTVLGRRLDFTRGRVSLTGNLIPDLDFMAESRSSSITAYVAVTGPADAPQFTFTSDPTLPQDEVLSQILFEKPSGSLSAGQALQLAQAAAQLAGGNNVFEQLRRSLGVDNLDISVGAQGGPTVGLSRAIGDRVSIGVKAGAKPEDSGISVDIDVTRRIRVQGGVGATGDTSIGVGAEWEY